MDEDRSGLQISDLRAAGPRDDGALSPADKVARNAITAMLFGTASEAERIGRYRVIRVLGEGGMGTVFSAYDDELARPVAVKLMREDRSVGETEAELARVRMSREAQAMAQLSHPNVVQVYDVGEHEGEVFIAMELIRGQTLQSWVEELGPAEVRAKRWRAILACFIQAARGLAAAHAVGIIHRDFKPANVLVGTTGQVRVVDFGLARGRASQPRSEPGDTEPSASMLDALESTGSSLDVAMTATGTVLGTPAYFSPEQLRGAKLDASTDQFSFCVALHEALFGLRPFAGTDFKTLATNLRTNTRVELPRSSPVPAWVRAVLDRGLAPTSDQRWPSMDALVEALLDDPARSRRRRIAVAVGSAALLGLGLGAWVQDRQLHATCDAEGAALVAVWNPEVRAEVGEAFAATEVANAEQTWTRVAPRIERWAGQWQAARVEACLDARREDEQGNQLPGSGRQRGACLERLRWQLETLVEILREPETETIHQSLNAEAALPPVEQCRDISWLAAEPSWSADNLDASGRGAEASKAIARSYVLSRAGRFAEALDQADAAIAEAGRLDDANLRVDGLARRGNALWRMGRLDEAEASLRQAFFGAASTDHERVALESAIDLALVTGPGLGRWREARDWLDHARAATISLGKDPADEFLWFEALGQIEFGEANYAAALEAYEATLAIQRRSLDPEHPEIAYALANIGRTHQRLGDYGRALEFQTEALELAERQLGSGHPELALMRNNLATTLRELGREDEALAAHRSAVELYTAALGPEHEGIAVLLNNLAHALQARGELDEAVELYERAYAIHLEARGPDHVETSTTLGNLAAAQAARGDLNRALELQREVLAQRERTLAPDHPTIAVALLNIGSYLALLGQFDEAATIFERALAIELETLGPEHPLYAGDLDYLGAVERQRGALERAWSLHLQAQAIRREALPTKHEAHARSDLALGRVRLAEDDPSAALVHFEAAETLLRSLDEPRAELLARALAGQGEARLARSELERAAAAFTAALELLEAETTPDRERLPRAARLLARVLEGRARVHLDAGQAAAARSLLQRAGRLRESAPGEPREREATRRALAALELGPLSP